MNDQDSILADETVDASETEVKLALLLESYLSDIEAGRPTDPERLIADHPELAGPLRACLEVIASPSSSDAANRLPRSVNPAGHLVSALSTVFRGGDGTMPRVLLADPAGDDHAPILTRPGLPVHAGRYQILGEIARGGMGAVLRARDADLGRELALKVLLRPHRDDVDLRNRFVEEAQIGGQLQHPGIVPVYELGAFPDQRPFLAMKLVRGRTLSSLLAERLDPTHDLPRFLTIFEQICQTVAYAHSRRVIHRDLKPSNVMVGSFGEVQVMDWGLAKVLPEGGVADERKRPDLAEAVTEVRTLRTEGSGSESQAGSVLGTPAYMAPEQARGEIDRIDERADVFGLGAMLCEILTGMPPFVGASRGEIQAMAARGDLSEAMTRLDGCGAVDELTRLTLDCLAPRPSDRPRDAAAVARRITAYTAGAQERLRAAELAKVEAQARAIEERKRRRLAVGLAASLIVLILTIGTGSAWWAFDRQARAARVDLAVRGVELLLDEARRDGDDLTKWMVARETASHLRPLLAEARDAATRKRVEALIESVDRGHAAAVSDRSLIDELNFIWDTISAQTPDETDLRYAEAFRTYGIDPDEMSPEDAARGITGRSTRAAMIMVAGLDNWTEKRRSRMDQIGAKRVDAVARRADADPWRNQVRDAAGDPNRTSRRESLRRLARETTSHTPATSITMLGRLLIDSREFTVAKDLLKPARDREPGNVWLNLLLAQSLIELGRAEEAIRYYTAAQAMLPNAALGLATALESKGETDQAIEVLRDLTQRQPDQPYFAVELVEAFKSRGRTRDANELLDAAIVIHRRRSLIRRDSEVAHLTYGNLLFQKGDVNSAIAQYREAIRLQPDLESAHINLGSSLGSIGRFREALEYLERGHMLGSSQPGWRFPSQALVEQHRRFLELDNKLPAILKGEAKPSDPVERLELAGVCHRKRLYAASARFAAEAFSEKPALASNPQTGARYNAACSASLASLGQGKDDPPPDETDRAKLRELALGWLKADVGIWNKILHGANEPARKQFVSTTLLHWKRDADLAGIREEANLAKLSQAERYAFHSLWAEVDALLNKASTR